MLRSVTRGLELGSLRRRRRRWENNIKMGLHETRWEGVDCIAPAQVRDKRWAVVNTVTQNVGNFLIAQELLASEEALCYADSSLSI